MLPLLFVIFVKIYPTVLLRWFDWTGWPIANNALKYQNIFVSDLDHPNGLVCCNEGCLVGAFLANLCIWMGQPIVEKTVRYDNALA